MDIFSFGFFAKFDDTLKFLSLLAESEPWNFLNSDKEFREGNTSANPKFFLPILRNYLDHTFRKVYSEDKVTYTQDKRFACFNTGLQTANLEEIYAYFEENRSYVKESQQYKSPYFFKAFIKASDREFLSLFSEKIPEAADYFGNPEDLIYDPKLNLIIDYDHVINDSKHRFPEHLKNASDRMVRNALKGAEDEIKQMIKSNYRMAIPEWYEGKIKLMLPLYLSDHDKPDLALIANKVNKNTYSAQTCLTVGMAYNNARLITRPRQEWVSLAAKE